MRSELCKTCIHTKVCGNDKNIVGDVFVMGHPMFFDNDKLWAEYKERKKQGFPCEDYMPTAEPKKGKWELQEDILSWEGTFDGYFCSECGKGFLSDLCCNNGADWVDVEKDFKFCPFCGADMRGEEDE